MDEEKKSSDRKSFEEVLSLVGEYGPFQWILNVIFITMHMASCVHLMLVSLSTLPPTWECTKNSSLCTQNGSFSGHNLDRCKYPREEWEYIGDKDFSMVSTFNLDCDREWFVHFLTSILFLAWAVGSMFFGWISDNYGRKQVLFVSTGTIIAVGFASTFCTSLTMYIVSRFVIGFFYAGGVLQPFIIISEVVGNRYRPFAGTMIWLSNSFAYSVLAIESYLVNNWRTLHILSTAPYVILFAFYKFIPESIQWQYEHSEIEKVKSTMNRIAYWNKKEVSLSSIDFILADKNTKRPNPTDLFRTKRITLLTLAQGSMWFCGALGYYALLLSVSGLGGSVYINFILLNFGSTFSYFVAPYCCTRFGRKKSCVTFQAIASILCICNGFIPFKMVSIRVIIGMIGMNFVAMAISTCYTWSGEIYPTRIRTEGLGFMEICSRLGSALSPWVGNYLQHFGAWVPYVVMGTFLMASALSSLPLPETKDGGRDFTKSEDENTKDVNLSTVTGVRNRVYSDDNVL